MKIEQIATTALTPYARNSRTHSADQVRQIAASITEFGFTNPVLIDADGGIIAGHCRVMAAKQLGMQQVPCIRLGHLSDAQKRAYVIADNKLAENSGWNEELLELELRLLAEEDFDFEVIGFDDKELADLLPLEEVEGLTDDDAAPEPPEQPTTVLGDVWLLGNHRLMCGDSTNYESIKNLMSGEMADFVLTDPPYGVAYVGKTKDALKIKSDDVSEEKLAEFCTAWFDNAERVSRPGAYWCATVPAGPLHGVFFNDWKRRGILRQVLVWVKDSMVLGHSEYHYRHEPILFGWVPGGDRLKNTNRKKTTVWEFSRPKASRLHPTMKPVEMWCFAIEQHTKRKNIIYEPFSGSGTTHIAAEKTGRICYGMELDPRYCDVIVNRWQNFTGKQATLEADGRTFAQVRAERCS